MGGGRTCCPPPPSPLEPQTWAAASTTEHHELRRATPPTALRPTSTSVGMFKLLNSKLLIGYVFIASLNSHPYCKPYCKRHKRGWGRGGQTSGRYIDCTHPLIVYASFFALVLIVYLIKVFNCVLNHTYASAVRAAAAVGHRGLAT